MTKRSNKLPLKILVYGVVLLLLYILQSAVFSRLPINGAKPMLFPLIVVCVAIFEGSFGGGLFGIAAGMLCDMSFDQIPAQFTLILAVTGIIIGLLSDTVFARGFPVYFISGIISVAICSLSQAFTPVLLRGIPFLSIASTLLWQFLYTLLFLLPTYIIVRRISRISTSY